MLHPETFAAAIFFDINTPLCFARANPKRA
jgi:hypothetical protein